MLHCVSHASMGHQTPPESHVFHAPSLGNAQLAHAQTRGSQSNQVLAVLPNVPAKYGHAESVN